jgi:hypothetical protein
MGHYDMVVVAEVPDDETMAKLALTISSGGAIRTGTPRVLMEEQYQRIIAALPRAVAESKVCQSTTPPPSTAHPSIQSIRQDRR